MTKIDMLKATPFVVIEGGRRNRAAAAPPPTLSPVFVSPLPTPDAAMLATELARLYALSLLRDVRFSDMKNPDCAIHIDGAAPITLRTLLTELSALPKRHPQDHHLGDPSAAALSLPCAQGATDYRRVSRGDGQWTCADLIHGGMGSVQAADPLSDILGAVLSASGQPLQDIAPALPDEHAPMEHWNKWSQVAVGVHPPRPDRSGSEDAVETPRDLALRSQPLDARGPAISAALMLLAQPVPFDAGLRQPGAFGNASAWTGPRLLSLMVEAARRSAKLLRKQTASQDQMVRPAVLAARLALMHECDDMRAGPDTARLADVLRLLKSRTPNLLDWIARLNAASGTGSFALPNRDGSQTEGWTPISFRQNLMLPALRQDGVTLRPGESAFCAVSAGALITLLKAVFATSGKGELTAALDSLASNIALGRCIAGGFYPHENEQNLRLGQGVALQLLRETMLFDGRSAKLDLCDFDGRDLTLMAQRRRAGVASVTLRIDGVPRVWPTCGPRRSLRHYAVV